MFSKPTWQILKHSAIHTFTTITFTTTIFTTATGTTSSNNDYYDSNSISSGKVVL